MPSAGFESAIPASERQQTYVLDLTATAIGEYNFICVNIMPILISLLWYLLKFNAFWQVTMCNLTDSYQCYAGKSWLIYYEVEDK